MPEELGIAYRCTKCNGILIAERELVLKHERILFGPKPPKRLVVFNEKN